MFVFVLAVAVLVDDPSSIVEEKIRVDGDENAIGILRILEAIHRRKSCSEMMDIEFHSVCCRRNARILEVVLERTLGREHEALVGLELDRIQAKDIVVQMTDAVSFACVPCFWFCLQE